MACLWQERSIFSQLLRIQTAELFACRRGILLAQEVDAQKVAVEMDSRTAVGKIANQHRELAANGQVVQEIKELLGQFQESRVVWVRRSVNRIAHILAREGCCKSLCKIWFHVAPGCISSKISVHKAMDNE